MNRRLIEHRILGAIGIALLLLLSFPLVAVTEWEVAREDYAWSFPEDHWARDGYKTEWWYFTGHLEAETGERFGYQFTFFRVGLLGEKPEMASFWVAKDLVMGHGALTQLPTPNGRAGDGERGGPPGHRFSEVLYRASPLLGGFGSYPDSVIVWCIGPAGTDGDWRLTWNGSGFDFEMTDVDEGFSFALSTRPVKPVVFQGPNGFSRKNEGTSSASQYYSFTRLATKGVVSVDGRATAVTGESWMDKEFGSNQLAAGQAGWDWFSLQLQDDREVMLYVLRDETGAVDYASGTIVDSSGEARYLASDEFELSGTATWTSPDGITRYPSRWRLSIPSASLVVDIQPELADQENRSKIIPTMRYWEGAVKVGDVTGKAIGQGFVELTGYGDSSRPAI